MPGIASFSRLYVWFSLRNLKNHPGRTLTVLFGISLGAAVFTCVRLSVDAAMDSFQHSMAYLSGRTEQVLMRPGGRVPEAYIPLLVRHPGVKRISPVLTAYVQAADKETEPFLLIGLDPILDRPFRSWRIQGTTDQNLRLGLDLLKNPYTLLLGPRVARQNGCPPGRTLALVHARRQANFTVIGTLESEGIGRVEGGRVALTDISTFQEFTGLYGVVDRIDVQFRDDQGIATLKATLPESVELRPPSAFRESGRQLIRSYQLNLSILSFASLFVGMFLVYSLVALNAASRRREIAVLRSLGASGPLLFITFLAEGAFFGAAGWLLALPIGGLLIKYLIRAVSQTIDTLFVRVQVDALTLSGWEILLGFGVTFFVSILAAFQPAWEAVRVPPKEAMEISQGVRRRDAAPRLAAIGLAGMTAVYPLARLPQIMGMPLPGYLAMFLLFAGVSLTAPWMLEKLSRRLSPALHRAGGICAYLGGRYVGDSSTRTAVSVGALMTAVALFTALVIMIFSFRLTVALWTEQTVSGDLFVTTRMGELNRFQFTMPPALVDTLQHLDADVDWVPSRRFSLVYHTFPYEFEAFDIETFFKYGDFVWLTERPDRIRPRVAAGEGVLISEVFSNRTGLKTGDRFDARIEESRVTLPILGIVRDYRTQGGAVFYSWRHFKDRFHPPQWSGVRFFLKGTQAGSDAAVAALRREILLRCGPNLDMIDGKALRGSILEVFDDTFAITSVLLLIALMIAALGIATTLTVRVLERSRQLNTIFALGAGFGQIRSMIFWEAGFMVVVGEIAGLACGFALSWILVYVVNRQSFGWTFLYGVDWKSLALSFPLIVLAALAAALPAVRWIFRQPPAMLLRE